MNRQDTWVDGHLLKRGIEWCAIHGRPGYTANPVKGCEHQCQWEMPDGTIATCYAKEIALGIAKSSYPNGFEEIRYDASELRAIERLQEPAGIFVDSMSDLFGRNVDGKKIQEVLDVMKRCPQHIFFSLTKNAPRLMHFSFPENLLVGISAPPTFMFGKRLTPEQQYSMLDVAINRLRSSAAKWRWISIEPLSFDVAPLIYEYRGVFDWAVVGAASRGPVKFQPKESHLRYALAALDKTPVFFKGNLDRKLAQSVAGKWREEFPPIGINFKQETQGVML